VAYTFVRCDRNQSFLMPPSLDEWLPQDHLARFVIAVVETLDLSAFYARRRTDGWGRAAYDPPDDGGPAHLRRVGLIALGSTRIQANASPGANRSAEWIRAEVERIIAEARATDEEEVRRLGDSTASHLPEDLIEPDARLRRLVAAKARLEGDQTRRPAAYPAKVAAREEFTRRTGKGLTGRKPKPPEERANSCLISLTRSLESTRFRWRERASTYRQGGGPSHYVGPYPRR